ncbi:MAG: hypothetical protein K1X29_11245 [Bdellovibrionales bacterium]|nr:hypothetical protein [Bdellovibrionales bacterium]
MSHEHSFIDLVKFSFRKAALYMKSLPFHSGGLLVAFFLISIVSNEFFLNQRGYGKMTPSKEGVVFTIMGIVCEIWIGFFLTLILTVRSLSFEKGESVPSIPYLLKKYFVDLLSEVLRLNCFALLWCLLFIVPGLFKYMRWTFVPYIVLADETYSKGERDALEYSNFLMKGITFKWLVLLLTVGLLQWGCTELQGLSYDWDNLFLGYCWRSVWAIPSFGMYIFFNLFTLSGFLYRAKQLYIGNIGTETAAVNNLSRT